MTFQALRLLVNLTCHDDTVQLLLRSPCPPGLPSLLNTREPEDRLLRRYTRHNTYHGARTSVKIGLARHHDVKSLPQCHLYSLALSPSVTLLANLSMAAQRRGVEGPGEEGSFHYRLLHQERHQVGLHLGLHPAVLYHPPAPGVGGRPEADVQP